MPRSCRDPAERRGGIHRLTRRQAHVTVPHIMTRQALVAASHHAVPQRPSPHSSLPSRAPPPRQTLSTPVSTAGGRLASVFDPPAPPAVTTEVPPAPGPPASCRTSPAAPVRCRKSGLIMSPSVERSSSHSVAEAHDRRGCRSASRMDPRDCNAGAFFDPPPASLRDRVSFSVRSIWAFTALETTCHEREPPVPRLP